MRIYQERAYEAMMATPANLEDVVAGEVAWATTRAVIYALVMLVVLAAFGLIRSPWALLVPIVAALGGFLFALIGLTYTSRLRHIEQMTFYFTLFITPQFLFSGIFFPLDQLPAPVQYAAWFTPLYHLVQLVRPLVLGTVGVELLVHAAWLAGLAVIVFPLPSRVLMKRLLV